MTQRPRIGDIVTYVSRTGNYVVPAIVNCTTETIHPPGVAAGFVWPLSSSEHVHLTVFSPGRPGMRTAGGSGPADFVNPSTYPISENVSGCYQEWDIAFDPDGGAGTWHPRDLIVTREETR